MKNVLGNARYWIAGTVAAAGGVALARYVGPNAAPGFRLPLTIGGQLLALAGLITLCVGVSRRVHRTPNPGP